MSLNKFLKIGVYITTIAISLVLVKITVHAEDDFTADYNISYAIDSTGIATVRHRVTITNQKSDVIATSYVLTLKQVDVYDISAQDKNGKLDITQKKEGDSTSVEIKLRSYTIGKGLQNVIDVFYKSNKVATKTGEVWTIVIPKAQSLAESSSYNVILSVPLSFGPKIYVSPTPSTEKISTSDYTYSFVNDQLKNNNITASFGKFQVMNFNLKYQLSNPNWYTANYEIALPSDIAATQEVLIDSLSPQPQSMHIDKDGNTIAVYRIKAKNMLSVLLNGSAKITSRQIDPAQGGSFDQLPASLVRPYTKAQPFWETEDKSIIDIAKELKDSTKTVSENAFKVYDYLVKNYAYDFDLAKNNFVSRKGAIKALTDKKEWGCMEFTDAFIAIARAMGIPAREINGSALTSAKETQPLSVLIMSGDLLHAWPEFYDTKFGWIQIDPTWGNTSGSDYFTKLDTDHLAFVRKGVSSEYPLAAGTYRTSDTENLVDVVVSEAKTPPDFLGSASARQIFTLNMPELVFGQRKYEIVSTGGITLYTLDGRVLLPYQKAYLYFPASAKQIVLKNALGEEISVPVVN